MKQQELEKIQKEVEFRDQQKKQKILNSMDEAEFRLRRLEDEKKQKQMQRKEQEMLKKMDRDR